MREKNLTVPFPHIKLIKVYLIYLIIVIEAVEGGQAVKRYLIKGDLYVRFSANV